MATCKGAGSSIFIVPATSYELVNSNGKKPKTPKKNAIVCGASGAEDGGTFYDPRNFLVRGGQRAYEQKIMSMNKCAIQELRTANAVLAEELVKARSGSEEVRDQLREKELSIEVLQATVHRLEKSRKNLDKKHLLQLKELNRRYKEEQAQRVACESECAQIKANNDACNQQVENLQEEKAQLMDLLNSQRSNASRLEATIAADSATVAELRSRVQAAESRLADEVSARQELFGRHKALEADLKLATERHSALSASNSETESRLRACTSKLQLLEDEMEAAKGALQAEKAACSSERQRAAALQSDLTQLQSASQLAAAAASTDHAEVSRLRGLNEQLSTTVEGLRTEVARLREETLHLTAQSVASQANAQKVQQLCDDLQRQRDEAEQRLAASREAFERLESGLQEEAAARLRTALEEAATRHRSFAEELTAKQRAWEGQLRTRETAWGDERLAMLRAHEAELNRKESEILEMRERMREAQTSVSELAAEVSSFRYQSEHYAEAYKEKEELKQRLTQAQEVIAARDASLAEAVANHAAQLELWKAEANEVAQAASKWKQRCTSLQTQLEEKNSVREAAEHEFQTLQMRLNASEAERLKMQEAIASIESKLELAIQEANSYRMQLSDVLSAHQDTGRHVEAAQHELQLRDMQLSRLNQSLSDEVARTSQLRQELSAAVAQHAKELDSTRRALNEANDQLHEADRSRNMAQAELEQLRERVSLLTRELGRARLAADAAFLRQGPPAQRSASDRSAGGARMSLKQHPEEDEGEGGKREYGNRDPSAGRRHHSSATSLPQDNAVYLEKEAENWLKALDFEQRRSHDGGQPAREGSSSRGAAVYGASRRFDPPREDPRSEAGPPPLPAQLHLHLSAPVVDISTPHAGPTAPVKAYEVVLSPKPEPSPTSGAPGLAAPVRQRSSLGPSILARATTAPVCGMPAGAVGGSPAAGTYTTVLLQKEQAPAKFAMHMSAPAPVPAQSALQRQPSASAQSGPTISGSRYSLPEPGYRSSYAFLQAAPPPPPQQPHPPQPQPALPYNRPDLARSLNVMPPMSPVMSESASSASSNLQERLNRLLGTGKLS